MMIAFVLAASLVMPSPVGTPLFHDEIPCPGGKLDVNAYDTTGQMNDDYDLVIYSYNAVGLLAVTYDPGANGKANAVYMRELNGNIVKMSPHDTRLKLPLCALIPTQG